MAIAMFDCQATLTQKWPCVMITAASLCQPFPGCAQIGEDLIVDASDDRH